MQILPENDFKSLLILNYYKNQLISAFANEALLCSAIYSFGIKVAIKEGINYSRVKKESHNIQNILQFEFSDFENLDFDKVLQSLIE